MERAKPAFANSVQPDEWIRVRTFTWLYEARVVASVLEAEGIPTFVPDAYTISLRPEWANALGGVRLMVPRSELKRARRVLATKGARRRSAH